MFKIVNTTNAYGIRTVRDDFATFAEAEAFARATYVVVYFEMDGAAAANFMTKLGDILVIEAV